MFRQICEVAREARRSGIAQAIVGECKVEGLRSDNGRICVWVTRGNRTTDSLMISAPLSDNRIMLDLLEYASNQEQYKESRRGLVKQNLE